MPVERMPYQSATVACRIEEVGAATVHRAHTHKWTDIFGSEALIGIVRHLNWTER